MKFRMWNQLHSAYLESRILTAGPMELIRLMYQTAIAEVRTAREALAKRDIRERSRAITKVCDILSELIVGLDRKAGGDYAQKLGDLYGYMMRQLTEANFKQRDEPLAEVLKLFTTLLENWEGAQKVLTQSETEVEVPVAEVPEAPIVETKVNVWQYGAEATYSRQAWSF